MITETKIRDKILKRIKRIPVEQLTEVEKYLKMLESQNTKKKKILSYAGSWKDLDDEVFRQFTNELITRRQENKRRNDEKSAD
jgi:hypothetical protein